MSRARLPRVALPFAATALCLAAWSMPAGAQWVLERKKVSPAPLEGFGNSVAVWGGVAVVGAPYGHGAKAWSGTAYVFERDERGTTTWKQVAQLSASDGKASDEFGHAVATFADRIVVGARDADRAYVYERNAGGPDAWGEVAVLAGGSGDRFGQSLAVSAETIAVGATRADVGATNLAGEVYVFERDAGGAWNEVAALAAAPPVSNALFGNACSLDGDTLAVGEPQTNQVHLFERDQGGPSAWGASQVLALSHGGGRFGYAVDVTCDTIVVGVPDHTHGVGNGAAFVFERDAGGPGLWGETAELIDADINTGDRLGWSVAVSRDMAVLGAPLDNYFGVGSDVGSVSVFARDEGGPGAWGQVQKIFASNMDGFDAFGTAVGILGDTFVATSIDNGPQPGWLHVYRGPSVVNSYCTSGTTANGCNALVDAVGQASVSTPSGFHVGVSGVEGQKQGLLYFGTSGAKASPWGGGPSYQCVKGPHTRTPTQSPGGTAGQCDGSFFLDFNAWAAGNPAKAPLAGDTVHLQAWFRDPPSPATTSLSNALQFDVCP